MASFAGASRKIVIRTSRETLGLLAAAMAIAFALSYTVHAKHDTQALPAAPPPVAQDASPKQDWAGGLAELTPATAPTPSEPMTSASLTVPKSQLALPAAPKPAAKPKPCMEPCTLKAGTTVSGTATPHHPVAVADRSKPKPEKSLVGMLNPLNHLPDMSAVGRPFTTAGGAVAGWFKRL